MELTILAQILLGLVIFIIASWIVMGKIMAEWAK